MNPADSALLTDLYHLNMIQAYLDRDQTDVAVFEYFVRALPARRNFLMAAGLQEAVDFVTNLRFSSDELDWLASTRRFSRKLLDYLGAFRFKGDVDAMPEGTIYFPNEPVLRVTAALPDAQLLETRLINVLHFQSLIASKAARMVLAAPGKLLIDFGLRRAHGAEAGLLAARASYLAGFAGTATVLAEKTFGIPIFGTMAHSFIEAHADESDAFEHYARSRPDNLVLLIDTYDTEKAARKVVELAPRLRESDIHIRGVRLDSGDLAALSRKVRQILDDGGLSDVTIFASGGLDEDALARFQAGDAPIDGFGIGTSLTTASDAPALDCAYKLQEYAGLLRRKRSAGKATWPGRKQVWRTFGDDGTMTGDVLSLESDEHPGEPLLRPVMREGRLVDPMPSLTEARAHAARELGRLPAGLRGMAPAVPYRVGVADALKSAAADIDSRT